MDLNIFKYDCKNKKCNRYLKFDEKTCLYDFKQERCYKNFLRKEEKKLIKKENKNYEYFLDEVWIRDSGEKKGISNIRNDWRNYCKLYKSLSSTDIDYLEKNDIDIYLNMFLEAAHIEPKSTNIRDKYNVNNAVLIGHLFHRRLTDLKHPVYQYNITNEEAKKILKNCLKIYDI